MTGHKTSYQKGMSLLELAVILVISGLMITVAVTLIPQLTDRFRLDTTNRVTIDQVKDALITFSAENSRLPCPDTSATANGLEGDGGASGCDAPPGDVVGLVPYRELGFADPILDEAHLPVRYAVYRNLNGAAGNDSSANTDLANSTNRFIPVLPGDPPTPSHPVANPVNAVDPSTSITGDSSLASFSGGVTTPGKTTNNANDLDFCLALRNAKIAAASPSFPNTLDLGGTSPAFNAAYVLASGGVEDADGDAADLAFDGTNEDTGAIDEVDFESPARRRNDSNIAANVYDDIIYAMPFNVLESKLECTAVTAAVNASANAALAAAHLVVQTEDMLWVALRTTIADDLAVTQAELSLALAIFQEIIIIADAVVVAINQSCPLLVSDAPAIPLVAAAAVTGLVNAILAGVALDLVNQQLAFNDAELDSATLDANLTNLIAIRMCSEAENADQRGGQLNAPATPAPPTNRP
jgi:type II secretory pathway pseudopilin PulG